ncbi:hypothetical protein [Maridesulfovibrio ferrireducens]|uniref:hypothetical protein n=1 Tax=Maridesulfovibrio ferrireducens TaxID=246191 RepID=UPI001A1E4A31|nr:hypothetical protein [Maridesulfovibrio ferrireducens]MBI9112419.1 hypothetical protein [Maridesulfovibrio ferrireducens]MBI9113030.1 hypothetical protein [Maridesulfovibrio ferrireducens]
MSKSPEKVRIPGTGYEMDRDGRCLRRVASPGYPVGYQKTPRKEGNQFCYTFSPSVFGSAKKLYIKLFKEEPPKGFGKLPHYNQLSKEAAANNEKLLTRFTRPDKSETIVAPRIYTNQQRPIKRISCLHKDEEYIAALNCRRTGMTTSHCPLG